ncbi:hypothetical protein MNBD_ALPHA06-2329 [hydrothermal vent metagenome]|uniref:HMA domain-containing protein n=1 Tax=hydrothermal vent metagenome TaxID=652676 RepID=A0A3B0RQ44_9ZZZZ
MKKITLAILAVGAISLGGFIFANQPASTAKDSGLASIQATQTKAQFAIKNMTCASCPISVRTAMKRVDGVQTVAVDFDSKIATVTFDPSRTNAQSVADASTNVGYPASKVED